MLDPFSEPDGPAVHVLPQLLQPGDVRGSMPARRVGCAVTIAGLETPALVIRLLHGRTWDEMPNLARVA